MDKTNVKETLKLITTDDAAILIATCDFPKDDPYIVVKEGNSNSYSEDSPTRHLIGEYFDGMLEELWENEQFEKDRFSKEFEIKISVKRIK